MDEVTIYYRELILEHCQKNIRAFPCDTFLLEFLYAYRCGINFAQVYVARNAGIRAGKKIMIYL